MSDTLVFRKNGLHIQPFEQKKLATDLLQNGFEPVPVYAAQKKPLIREWQCPHGPVTLDRVLAQIENHPDHTNMGLLTRNMSTVDIDLYDPDLTAGAQELVEFHFGYTPLQRFGSKGIMLLYRRVGEPFGKKTISRTRDGKHPDNMDARQGHALIELFGNGQIVGFGAHPNTLKPYRWLIDGMSPLTVALSDLPPVTEDMMDTLKLDLIELLCGMGYQIGSTESKVHKAPPPKGGHVTAAKNFTELFMALVPTYRQSSSGYINFACPNCNCNDRRAGIQVLANGGFFYKCFHASCEYNRATGWQPPARCVGDRAKELYRLLGGDPSDLQPIPWGAHMKSYSSVKEMREAFHPTRK